MPLGLPVDRREFLKAAALAAIGGIAVACGRAETSPIGGAEAPTLSPTAPPPTTGSTSTTPPVATPDVASLRRRIGALLVVGFRGLEVHSHDPIVRAIVEDGLGGVVLFDRDQLTGGPRNIASPEQVAELTNALRTYAGDRPFRIAIDQEGGRVARLTPATGFPATVSEAQLGRSGDPAVAFDAGQVTARTLKAAGIDWNLAPVVDLNVNPSNPSIGALDRSFSADPAVVVAMATAIIRAHHDEGILTTLKHYPGLGSATGDTDRDFVDVTKTWRPQELEPFRQLIASGVADTVMVANAVNGRLDPDRPASLSEPTVTGSLRDDLDWQGVVVTDDLQAGAIAAAYDDAEAIELALGAGNDVLLLANQQVYDDDVARRTIDVILGLVDRGKVTEARLDASNARIAGARDRASR